MLPEGAVVPSCIPYRLFFIFLKQLTFTCEQKTQISADDLQIVHKGNPQNGSNAAVKIDNEID